MQLADVVATVVSYLAGSLRQRRTGLGWRIAALSGAGSQQVRADATTALFARATADEQRWLRGLVTGEVRQGALDDVRLDRRSGDRGTVRRRTGAG